MLGGSQSQSAGVVPARRLTGRRAAIPGDRLEMLPKEEAPVQNRIEEVGCCGRELGLQRSGDPVELGVCLAGSG